MREINICKRVDGKNGIVVAKALVDDEDYVIVNKYSWYMVKYGYAVTNVKKTDGKQIMLKMHKLVTGTVGSGIKVQVDHINNNKLDNRRANLRVCSPAENKRNCKMSVKNTTGFKGVSYHKQAMKWRAMIMVNGKKIHLGLFICILKAAKTYDEAAIKYFGEFACTNKSMGLL